MEMPDVEKARSFWSQLDVEMVFAELMEFLMCLRQALISKTASGKDYIQAMNIIVESEIPLNAAWKNDSFEEVLINEEILTVSVTDSHCTVLKMTDEPLPEDITHGDISRSSRNLESGSENSQTSLSSRIDALLTGKSDCYDSVVLLSPSNLMFEDHLAPMSPVQVSYQQHDCSPACTSHLPKHEEHFLGHNPLRVPLLCRFQRNYVRLRTPEEQEEETLGEESDSVEADVLYKAPCGRGLRCMDDVVQFLTQTKSLGILQPFNFSFNPEVMPELQAQASLSLQAGVLSERDISRGIEAVPVPLCNDVDGIRPKEFRYRKERWPHGCFLSAAPFFSACCDCVDGCTDSQSCSCLQLSLKAGARPHQLYTHQRLEEPVPTGLYECGPWCRCEKSRCQNRPVQHGLRVRLQVFRTCDKGWGVRCRDDLDKGTFICTYAGVVLRLERCLEEPLKAKNPEEEAVSDDEVEVVEEWTLPAGEKKAVTETLDNSPPLYVPVIQRPTDQSSTVLDGEKEQREQTDQEKETDTCSSHKPNTTEIKNHDDEEKVVRKKPRLDFKVGNGDVAPVSLAVHKGDAQKQGSQEQMYYLDASKEGNVSRFFNHSCSPNLFVQNVFVDTHDAKFPVTAFFTCRTIKAGTELTWNYSYDPGRDPEHEVPCRCSWENCQEVII